MAEIINCPQCMGDGCDGCGETGEVLCLALDDIQRVADSLATIQEGQAEYPGQAPRWLILCVHRGDSGEMQARARVIREHPGTCMVTGLAPALTIYDAGTSSRVVPYAPMADGVWPHA